MGRASTELARGSSRRVRTNGLGFGYSYAEECLPRLGAHEAEYGHWNDPGRHDPSDFVLGKDRYAAPLLRCSAFDGNRRIGRVDLGRVLFRLESRDRSSAVPGGNPILTNFTGGANVPIHGILLGSGGKRSLDRVPADFSAV